MVEDHPTDAGSAKVKMRFRPRSPLLGILLVVVGVIFMGIGSTSTKPSFANVCPDAGSCVVSCDDPQYSQFDECQGTDMSAATGLGFVLLIWGAVALVLQARHRRRARTNGDLVAPPTLGESWKSFSRWAEARKKAQDARAVELQANVMANKAANAVMAYCNNCKQAVSPVRKGTATRLALTGGVGYALSAKDSCPICRAKNLSPMPPAQESSEMP